MALLCDVWPGPVSPFNTWISLTSTFDVQSSLTLLLSERKASNTESKELYKVSAQELEHCINTLMFPLNGHLVITPLVSPTFLFKCMFFQGNVDFLQPPTLTCNTVQPGVTFSKPVSAVIEDKSIKGRFTSITKESIVSIFSLVNMSIIGSRFGGIQQSLIVFQKGLIIN